MPQGQGIFGQIQGLPSFKEVVWMKSTHLDHPPNMVTKFEKKKRVTNLE
jgi:hypothetical protein